MAVGRAVVGGPCPASGRASRLGDGAVILREVRLLVRKQSSGGQGHILQIPKRGTVCSHRRGWPARGVSGVGFRASVLSPSAPLPGPLVPLPEGLGAGGLERVWGEKKMSRCCPVG